MTICKEKIKVIAFDADDTLWESENYFLEIEKSFVELMSNYISSEKISSKLFNTEMSNLKLFGYGAKGFTLSMIETAIKISNSQVSADEITQILNLGKSLLSIPIKLIDDVKETLDILKHKYKLVVATKGDLLDQENKLKRSGLIGYFHHIEIMTNKREENYKALIHHLDITAEEFLMIGNSLKSDILPVTNIGGQAAHIPFHITWEHEKIDEAKLLKNFINLKTIKDILKYIN